MVNYENMTCFLIGIKLLISKLTEKKREEEVFIGENASKGKEKLSSFGD